MSIANQAGISEQRRLRALREASSFEEFHEAAVWNKEELQASYEAYQLSDEEVAFLDGLKEPVDVLALAHDWCGDVVANLPLFARLAERTDKLKLHVLPRDPDNRDIADAYLHADGRSHIPTYLFFSSSGEELGVFIERPEAVSELLKTWIDAFWNEHPELADRGTALKDLEEPVRAQLLAFVGRRRAETATKELEKTAILAEIQRIIGG